MRSILAVLVALTSLAAAALAAPMLGVDSAIYAVEAQAGTSVAHTFVVTNVGDELLTISRVFTSCGCTTAALAKQQLAPGESVNIDVTINTTGFSGVVTRTVTVESNDPTTPAAVLQIEISVPAAAEPLVQEIAPGELKPVFYLLIDVRTPEEYAAGHLLGALNIPLSEFQTNLETWLPRLPREIPLIIYCLGGVRSLQAATILVNAGVTNVLNLAGGITRWQQDLGDRFLFAW